MPCLQPLISHVAANMAPYRETTYYPACFPIRNHFHQSHILKFKGRGKLVDFLIKVCSYHSVQMLNVPLLSHPIIAYIVAARPR